MPSSTAPLNPFFGAVRTISRRGYSRPNRSHTSSVPSRLLSSTIMISYSRPASAAAMRGTSSGKFSASANVGTMMLTMGDTLRSIGSPRESTAFAPAHRPHHRPPAIDALIPRGTLSRPNERIDRCLKWISALAPWPR